MLDLKKTQHLILEATPVLGRESVPLLDAMGRTLFEDIVVVEDLPASNISALDGYAVCQTSLSGISPKTPAHLKIIGESPAGNPCNAVVGEGDAVRIMTGGVLPQGADTIVKLEEAKESRGYVICSKRPAWGNGIRFQGDSLKKGEALLHAGDIIRPLEAGALATLRRAYVCVHQKPMVAILSTGDELSDFHEPALASTAMCSNLYALAAQVAEACAIPLCLGIVKDDLKAQQTLLKEALRADVIITSGGTSRGRYDLIHKAFAALGMEMRFSTLFAKPGKPTLFGTLEKKLIFGLPGNPSATMLSFEQFIKPALLKMMGHPNTAAGCAHQNPLSHIDSFNRKQGGNKDHHRASQVPLKRAARGHCHRQSQAPAALPGRLKIVAR